MMRDHRFEKLLIPHGRLISDKDDKQNKQPEADARDDQVDLLVVIHRPHYEYLDYYHRGRHQARHIKLINVRVNVGESDDHHVHEHKHRNE